MADYDFQIILEGFNEGNAPLAHIDNKTFIGNKGQASEMEADIISRPGFLTQSPALVDLVNGNESGVVSELIRFILDRPVGANTTYAIGTSKIFKVTATDVVNVDWPQAVANMTEGQSIIRLKQNVFFFYNRANDGDIAVMPITTEVIDQTWGSTTVSGGVALQKAPHPTCTKEDLLLFGNGRYVGVYIALAGTLDAQKLDFGEGAEVADIVFTENLWWIAVNYGAGARTSSEVFMYDGSALSNVLADEAGVGMQKIGFLYLLNGLVYLCYDDLTSEGYTLGFIAGRQLKPLRHFNGTLPDHRQKTLYKNTILFLSGSKAWSCGAVVEQLPIQISQLTDIGHAQAGGIAAPFGVPMMASTDNSGHYRIAQLSGYRLDSVFKTVYADISNGVKTGKVATIVVTTKPLAENAKCIVTLEDSQEPLVPEEKLQSRPITVEGKGITRHVTKNVDIKATEDVRAVVTFTNGSAVDDCPIRKIVLLGNYIEG